MEIDRLWKRNSSRHEQAWPNNCVEPQNVLADNMDIAGPKLLDPFNVIAVRSKVIDSSQIVREGINPHVHDVIVIESFGNADSPGKSCTADRQVSEWIGCQSAQNIVSMLFGSNKIRIVLDVLNEFICVGRHFKEIGLLFDPLQRDSRCGILEIIRFRRQVGNEGFLSNVIPAGVGVQVNIAIVSASLPELPRHSLVTIAGRTHVIVV
mmetsp:Transcript_12715/g.32033  ORF Transcript_12715/g.32033 Transcript_12715/m.32033 type:complete len:208 (+) Transcript_12715:1214-1837(+)